MSFAETAALGSLAGFTIYLGLPLGRLRTLSTRGRVSLAMVSVGILAFIFVDVLQHALSIVQAPIDAARPGHGNVGKIITRTLLLGAGFLIGCSGLAVIERRLRPMSVPPIAGGAGPVVETADVEPAQRFRPSQARKARSRELARREAAELARAYEIARVATLRRGLAIAVAIGLHNFAEGLAIGVSARAGAVGLATVLVIGFALHNATEGFGIVGPLGDVVPSWKWLGRVGLIAGGPTFLGATVGYAVTSVSLELAFYALAAGAILYVIGEVWHAMRRYGHRELGLYMLAAGFMIGVVTDLIVSYGGG
ncbi:MAG TPA: ZIP family metal transporter [Solirubrobacteraceae bacterium]|nr:ZIP family metal transporter [Solirubrobacteraceae bacterium]